MYDSKQRSVIVAAGGSFTFSICCCVSTSERVKRDLGRKSGPISHFLTPVKFRAGWTKCF